MIWPRRDGWPWIPWVSTQSPTCALPSVFAVMVMSFNGAAAVLASGPVAEIRAGIY